MVGVAQLVERWIVIPVVVGSIPIVHPIFFRRRLDREIGRLCCFCREHASSKVVPARSSGCRAVLVPADAKASMVSCAAIIKNCPLQSSGGTPIKAVRFQPVETPARIWLAEE